MSHSSKSSDKRAALQGSLWTLGGYGASQVIRLASSLILARLLFPEAFGLMALVNVFMQGLEMLSDVGIGPSIIQTRRGADPRFLRTAWTIQALRGLGLWLIACALARPAAAFFSAADPQAAQLSRLLPVASLVALFGGLGSTALFTLNRRLEMRKLTAVTLVPQVVTLAASAAWALADRSVWAIVAGGLAGSLVRLGMSHALNDGPRDRFAWDREAAAEIGSFGRWVFLSTVVSFLAGNLDRVVLGRLLSLGELGLYSIGMTFARVATQVATRLTNTVVFPLLSKHQDRPERLLAFAARARAAVLWAGGAICAGFAIFAPVFFEVLYDERYRGAGVISQWLALYIWTWVLNATIDRIPLAMGRPRALFAANLAGSLGMVLAWLGYRLAALPGFVAGMAVSNLAGQVCLQRSIPGGSRGRLARQSLVATLAVAGYTIPLLLALRAAASALPPWAYGVLAGLAASLPILLSAWVVRRMLATPATPPELADLALGVSTRRAPMTVLRERGEDVLIARAAGPDGRSVIVKLWNRRGWRGWLRRVSGTAIAQREWEALRRLRTEGLGVPAPLACFSLTAPGARHTEALVEEDLGACRDATEVYKAMLREGRADEAGAFEEAILHATETMLRRNLLDTDHRLPNFVVRPDGRPVRLDFELARPVRHPRRHRDELGRMVGTFLGSYVFAVQPDAARARAFALRLQERLRLDSATLRVATSRAEQMLERQRREINLDIRVEWPW